MWTGQEWKGTRNKIALLHCLCSNDLGLKFGGILALLISISMKWESMYPASQRIMKTAYPAYFLFVQKASIQYYFRMSWGTLPDIHLKFVQDINTFILCFRNPKASKPIGSNTAMGLHFRTRQKHACYKNVINLSGRRFHVFHCVRFTRRWERAHILVYMDSHPKLSLHWNTAETEFRLISTWNHNSSQVHLKCAPM